MQSDFLTIKFISNTTHSMYTYFSDKLLNCYHDVFVVLQKQEIGYEDSCFPSAYTWRDEQLNAY